MLGSRPEESRTATRRQGRAALLSFVSDPRGSSRPTATISPTAYGGSGVFVAEGAVNNTLHRNVGHHNAEFDGFDGNPECDNNDWSRNRFHTVNQPCVADGGTGSLNGPGRSGEAPGRQDDGPAANRG